MFSQSSRRHVADASDRAAFRSWFVLLADAAVRAAAPRGDRLRRAGALRVSRGAARAHAGVGAARARCRSRRRSPTCARRRRADARAAGRCSASRRGSPARYAEFADARTLVTLNARPLGRDTSRAAAGRPAVFPPAGADAARSPDGVRRPVVLRSRARATGSSITPGRSTAARARCARCGCAISRSIRRRAGGRSTSNQQFVGVFRLAVL